MSKIPGNEYSAKVRLWLEAEECCLSVARVGLSSLELSDSAPPRFSFPLLASLITIVDGEEMAFLIRIIDRRGSEITFEHCSDFARRNVLEPVPF